MSRPFLLINRDVRQLSADDSRVLVSQNLYGFTHIYEVKLGFIRNIVASAAQDYLSISTDKREWTGGQIGTRDRWEMDLYIQLRSFEEDDIGHSVGWEANIDRTEGYISAADPAFQNMMSEILGFMAATEKPPTRRDWQIDEFQLHFMTTDGIDVEEQRVTIHKIITED